MLLLPPICMLPWPLEKVMLLRRSCEYVPSAWFLSAEEDTGFSSMSRCTGDWVLFAPTLSVCEELSFGCCSCWIM